MKNLFEKTTINGVTLNNRFVRSATWEGMCEKDGRPTPKLASCYRDLAAGCVGFIITGYAFVRSDGKQLPGKMGIHADNFATDMRLLTQAVHSEGGKICIQLVHAGGQTTAETAGRRPLAPSAVKVDQFPEESEAMTKEDIDEIIAAFGDGARRAKEYGFDAVQIHAAHGYLINQFLSPLTNRRTDSYGGPVDNRCRFLLEVYRRVRFETGPDFPVLAKLNGSDNLEGGLDVCDAVFAARLLDQEKIDAIEVSGGTSASGEKNPVRIDIDRPDREAYNLALAREIKKAVRCPIMVVGGFRSLEPINKALREDGIDYISLARPFIREPQLVKRWQEGDDSPARCISCNGCFRPGIKEGGIYCVVEKKEARKRVSSTS
ncbi:MAG: NADH:flavin oxidoreductase [Thermodesulfovibrionales bacterium]|jgi:2,4-dienoyl-CoA reductase-like NADH-dependent reductase (Old Yellow Enzyme family)